MSLDVNISEPDEFNCVELHTVIEDLVKIYNIEDFTYHVDYISGKGDNYVANLFRVIIKDEKNIEKKIIVKTLINTERQQLFHLLHLREVFVYKEIMPEFEKILLKYYKNKKLNLAKCHLSCTDPGKEVIILEDLVDIGFQMIDKFNDINYEHASLIFKKLAKFHALSFILQKEDPDTFYQLKSNCRDIIFDDDFLNKTKLHNYFSEAFKTSANLVIDKDNKNILLNKLAPNVMNIMQEYLKPKRYNVLCHGDLWINNIMFKTEEEKPIDVIFIDFQAMRYACPVTDIMYFIYICTDLKFRETHLHNLLDLYYNTLNDVLKVCEIEINEAYPRESFDEDIREFENFGLICALNEMKMVTVRPEDEVLLQSMKIGQDVDLVDRGCTYALRTNELVTEFSKKGNLNKL